MPYVVYLLRCADGTFYAGVTTDLDRRLVEHNGSSRGAKYTGARRPVTLVYREACPDRSAAQKREHALRRLTHAQKEALAISLSPQPLSQPS